MLHETPNRKGTRFTSSEVASVGIVARHSQPLIGRKRNCPLRNHMNVYARVYVYAELLQHYLGIVMRYFAKQAFAVE